RVSSVAMSSAHGWLPANEREAIVELHVARLVLAGRAADGDARCDLAQEVAREVIDELLQALAVRYDRRPARGDRRVGHLVIIDDHAAAAPPLGALGLVGDEVSGLDEERVARVVAEEARALAGRSREALLEALEVGEGRDRIAPGMVHGGQLRDALRNQVRQPRGRRVAGLLEEAGLVGAAERVDLSLAA